MAPGTETIRQAHTAGLPIVGITGQDASMEGVDALIRTVPQERSATHTASYTASLTALALIAAAWGERAGTPMEPLRAALAVLPDHIAAVLAREDAVRPVAAALAERGRLVLMGAGPNAVTAREGALKVKESSYLEVIWADRAGVTCRRWSWRQGRRTRLTTQTRQAYFVLDRLAPYTEEALLTAGEELAGLLRAARPASAGTRVLLGGEHGPEGRVIAVP